MGEKKKRDYDLNRFVDAQEGQLMPFCSDYATAIREIRNGRKTSHWIWYVLPQLKHLGKSEMSERYGIDGLGEAEAYLRHPILRYRLVEMARAIVEGLGNTTPHGVVSLFGGVTDATKAQASLTLFHEAAMIVNDTKAAKVFAAALKSAFACDRHIPTMSLLGVDMECLV